jgi:hypothetical protein
MPYRVATLLLALGAGLALAADADRESSASRTPPKDAVILFGAHTKDLSDWQTRDGKPAGWSVENGYIQCVPGKGDIRTKQEFGPDVQLHAEFWLPLMEKAKGQGRANSGVYLLGRWEVQVLDSYMNETYANGSVGALYGLIAPDPAAQKKAIKPPEQWNTYDITFRSPRVDGSGKVTEKGEITVVLNAVTLIDRGQFDKATGGAIDDKIGRPGPILLQDHGNRVRYRNIWLKPLSSSAQTKTGDRGER